MPRSIEGFKEEVCSRITPGFSPDKVWTEFSTPFASRKQFGAVIAWAKGALKEKKSKPILR